MHNNIVNLSTYCSSLAEQNISNCLTFVPKLKLTDLPNVRRGLIKFRVQLANIYEAEYRRSLNELSQLDTSYETWTAEDQNPTVPTYNAKPTIDKLKH